MISEDDVLKELNKTGDPGVGIGIVDLGLVAELRVEDDFVFLSVRTTTPSCPFQPFIMMEAHRKLMQLNGVKGAQVEVTHNSPWHPNMMSESAKDRLGFLTTRVESGSVPEARVGVDAK